MKNGNGFVLAEILISLSLIMLFIMPFTYFLFGLNSQKIIEKQSRVFLKDINKDIEIESNINNLNLNDIDNQKSCNLLLSTSTQVLSNIQNQIQIKYSPQISSNQNLPSSIEMMHGQNGQVYIYIGMNSASTTDPDLLLYSGNFSEAFATSTVFGLTLFKQIFLGPGINNMVRSANEIVATERSSLTPIWKANLDDLLNLAISNPFKPIASSSINHTFPLSLRLNNQYISIGTEKNTNREAYVLNSQTGLQQSAIEINTGINDLLLKNKLLYIASPKNPELEVYDISSSSPVNPKYIFDAPGSSGNGKSLAFGFNRIFLGRTIGNDELISMKINDDATTSSEFFKTATSFNPDESILNIMPIDFGRILILTTNNKDKALIFLRSKSSLPPNSNSSNSNNLINSKDYEKWFELSLPSTVEDYVCGNHFIIAALKSTSTPLVNIKF